MRAFACIVLLWAVSAAAQPAPVIRHIAIQGNTRTRTEVIRRELLFAEGDTLDAARIEETARNLRGLFFLGRVEVRVQAEDGAADVTVAVEDLYARALSPLLSGEIGELSYGGVALDYNFLGRGQVVRLTAEHDAVSGNRAAAYYRAPRLLGSRHAVTADVGGGAEGHDVDVSLSRPFHALSARWAYGVSGFSQEEVRRLYTDQALTDRYTDRLDGGSLWVTRSFGDRIKVRPNVQVRVTDRRFAPSAGFSYAPEDRRRVLPSVGMTVWRPQYEKARFIHGLGRIEDLQMGSWVSLYAGLSHRRLGSDRGFRFFQAQISPRFRVYDDGYVFVTLFLGARRQGGRYDNISALAELRAYVKVREVHSLALRVRWDAQGRTEDAGQLLLGVDDGLRGYAPRRFDGSRRFLFNLEARPTFWRRRSAVLAGALFIDGGTAWTPGRGSPPLNASAGVGARLALTRVYNHPILRADLCWGFRDRAWQISVGISQYF